MLMAGWFAVDAVRYAIGSSAGDARSGRSRARRAGQRRRRAAAALRAGLGLTWVVAIAGALRIFGIAWSIMVAPVYSSADADETVVSELGLADQPEAVAIAAEVEAAERTRAPIDRGWTLAFVATLFAIHIGPDAAPT